MLRADERKLEADWASFKRRRDAAREVSKPEPKSESETDMSNDDFVVPAVPVTFVQPQSTVILNDETPATDSADYTTEQVRLFQQFLRNQAQPVEPEPEVEVEPL